MADERIIGSLASLLEKPTSVSAVRFARNMIEGTTLQHKTASDASYNMKSAGVYWRKSDIRMLRILYEMYK